MNPSSISSPSPDPRSFPGSEGHVHTPGGGSVSPASIHVCTSVSEQRLLHIMMRVSESELTALRQRCPVDSDLTTWMRSTCLGCIPGPGFTPVGQNEEKRTKRLMIRVTASERTALLGRCPPEMDLSPWMRTACLAQPLLHEDPTVVLVPALAPSSEAELIRARAFMALVQMCSEQVDRFRRKGSVENVDGLRRTLREILAQLEEKGGDYDL